MMKKIIFILTIAFGFTLVLAQENVPASGGGNSNSYTNVLDLRDSFGGWLTRGTATVSRVAVEADAGASIELATRAGEPAGGIDTPEWDSTAVPDGLYTATLHEGGQTYDATLAVLNAPDIAVHGGCLEANETWDASKVHVVQYAVRVPSGVTLTIADDAIVKFCEGTGLLVDEGGQLSLGACVFTHIDDDTHGGDTNLDGDESVPIVIGYELWLEEPEYSSVWSPKFFYAQGMPFCQEVVPEGCTETDFQALPGKKVTLTVLLPEGENPEFWKASWSGDPAVEFTAADDLTATFTMPAEAVSVICELIEKPLEDTAIQRVLHLEKGWNPVVLSLTPDEESIVRLEKFSAMTLDVDNECYVRVTEFTADGLYWLYASEAGRLVVTGEAAVMPLPQGDGWQPYGGFPAATLEGNELWQWQEGVFHRVEPQTEPGRGYFIRKAE